MEKITILLVTLTLIAAMTLMPIHANEVRPEDAKIEAEGKADEETTTEPVFDPNETFTGKPAYDESLGGFVYEEDGNGGCIITGYNELEKSIIIPPTIGDMPVTGIGETAFYAKSDIVSVTIPEGVTFIARDAFGDCKKLATVALPSTLTEIGYMAFRGCEMLRSIVLPEGLVSIGDFAFEGCLRLRSLKAPSTLAEIGIDAFAACSSLILDTSANTYAAEYAEKNAIPSTFTDTLAFNIMICAVIAVAALGGFAIVKRRSRINKGKKSK